MNPGPLRHLNQIELARRWGVSERTLERWRWKRQGPPFMKIGGRVAYALVDIETFEAAQRRDPARASGALP
jgi:hypothetical protein